LRTQRKFVIARDSLARQWNHSLKHCCESYSSYRSVSFNCLRESSWFASSSYVIVSS
jgi:hypothetical protein